MTIIIDEPTDKFPNGTLRLVAATGMEAYSLGLAVKELGAAGANYKVTANHYGCPDLAIPLTADRMRLLPSNPLQMAFEAVRDAQQYLRGKDADDLTDEELRLAREIHEAKQFLSPGRRPAEPQLPQQ